MCGIAGFIDFKSNSSEKTLENMVASLHHRGPNDSGSKIFIEKNCRIGFGQTRLSIIDLTSAGHQPMFYKNYVIVFNGEIYNYKEIRKELEKFGHVFKTQTDTEVILHSFKEWGIDCVNKLIGMFAFVIYDSESKKIIAVRDRAGVKPLYYYYKNGLFLFGSELKALMIHENYEKEIDANVLPNYFNYGYIAAPYTIFKHTRKLLPGYLMILDIENENINTKSYWNLKNYYTKPKLSINYQDAKQELKTLMHSAFNYRMVADVPIGVFLSGGYDSTAVTAMLQSNTKVPLRTYTIGFEKGKNEAPFAKQIAAYIGTEHTEYICTTREAQEIIPTLPFYYDEPFGDSSAIPTILVSRLAKKEVTVALSADGGDELFCGYESYFKLAKYIKIVNNLPSILAIPASKTIKLLEKVNFFSKNRDFYQMQTALLSVGLNKNERAAYLFQAMAQKPENYIENFFSNKIIEYKSGYEIDTKNFSSGIDVAMAIDFSSYLPNDILTKVDRATMSVSLEGREPFLDHRIIEFAAQLPLEYKCYENVGKRILKDIVHDFLPKEMMDRPKSGFSLPIYEWLRGDLSYLVDEYLSKEALSLSGLFNVDFLLNQVKKFKDSKLFYSPLIWYLLMFQMWWKHWMLENKKAT
jgi:asparagine synthase (glutamine-hydrolysing)